MNEITYLFDTYGDLDYIGESISQKEHFLQCAYLAAKDNPNDKEMQIACLLHDIGHLLGMEKGLRSMGGWGVSKHEHIGSDWLMERGFSERICLLVRHHIDAKRYLCAVDPEYKKKLSIASTNTLKYQGGPMTEIEAEYFSKHKYLKDILKLRRFDENAKIIGLKCPRLDHYRSMIIELSSKDNLHF